MNSSCSETKLRLAQKAPAFACMFIASAMLASAGDLLAADPASLSPAASKMDPAIAKAVRAKSTQPLRVLIEPTVIAVKDLPERPSTMPREQRLRATYDALSSTARTSQAPIVRWLRKQGVSFRTFTVVNVIAAELTPAQLGRLAARDDVRYLADDPQVRNALPGSAAKDACNLSAGVPYGVDRVNANDVWALGARGQGVVVAGQDTGYDFDHPSLIAQYRGNGPTVVHDYNWHDAIHALIAGGSNSCGINLAAPCDDNSHGTHTMGTMVGEDDGTGFTVGVAPDAKWIGCRNMEEGDGTPSTYLECFDWFLAPTDLAGNNPDPSKAPHAINNSWGCPTSEGCTSANWAAMDTAVNNLTAAGILVVASAGNSGSSCGSINTPAAMYPNALTVAWTNSGPDNSLNTGSSRGPVTVDGSNRAKPDISAPGSSICSTVPGTGFSSGFSGTSMAGPHVAGVAALLMSAFPELKNDPPAVREFLQQSATPLPQTGTCGGTPGSARPNPFTGWGLVNALAAYQMAQANLILFDDSFE
jgi:serine protease AprX